MKRIITLFLLVVVFVTLGCTGKEATSTATEVVKPSADTITAASGSLYYAAGSYDLPALQAVLGTYPYKANVGISTTNADQSPNLAVAIPGITADGKYLSLGLADNRTKENLIQRELAVVMFYEYNPTAVEKVDRNKGCRVVAKYVGDSENNRINTEANNKNPSLFLEILEILPLG